MFEGRSCKNEISNLQVAPAELEALLRTHPNISEAGVVGIPDDRYGELPKAFVVLKEKDKTTPEEIQNFIKGKVSEFKELRGKFKFHTLRRYSKILINY